MRLLSDEPDVREQRFVFDVRTAAEAVGSEAREIEQEAGKGIVTAFVPHGETVLRPCSVEHRYGSMRDNIKERPKGSIAVADAVENEFGVTRRHNAAHPDHSHKINGRLGSVLTGPFVPPFGDLVDLARRKIHRNARTKARHLFVRQRSAAYGLSLREDALEQPH